MPTPIELSSPKKLSDADLTPRGRVFPSPADWRDQTLYFLLPDRFSDGNEAGRQPFDRDNPSQFSATDKAAWMAAGKRFTGGNLSGIRSQLGYLKDLGVTALWVGPIWQQCPKLETYHGYGIQNFLEVDGRFGTRQDLRDLVDDAHDRDMYVLLDIIYNHAGDVFFYKRDGHPESRMPYRFRPPYPMHGWRSESGASIQLPAPTGDAVWPQEFQDPGFFTRAGEIGRFDPQAWEDPLHPDTEFRRGDFFDLKNLELQNAGLSAVIDVYRYWMALTDCDGFRIDTVKHVPFDVSRHFCGGIREFAETIGKSNFLLLGEVTGGSGMARNYLDIFGRNLDAALDIGDPAQRLTNMVKGFQPPEEFFRIFGGHDQLGSHREAGRYHVSILDDHDMVGRTKRRFAAGNKIAARHTQVAHAAGVQMTTLGIPCIYYGTEQGFDGSLSDHDAAIEALDINGTIPFEDRYIRECMFGGAFGAFRTAGCHFFDRNHPAYLRIAAIARVRNRKDGVGLALRRGRSYLREVSFDGSRFFLPGKEHVAAWSRFLFRTEVVTCLNTDGNNRHTAHVTIDAERHRHVNQLKVLYRSDWSDAQLKNPPQNESATVGGSGGRRTIEVSLPPAGMMILSA
ncbi:MAG: alpha-amylase [Bryobacteraceae bacterium]|nr:alpha-amylase [Bryobacteraceae bacterium]